jgi:hypothetical protein
MRKRSTITKVGCLTALALMLAAIGFAGSASAKLTGEFTKFQYCPYKTAGVDRCLHSVTNGGEIVLGSKKVPIVNPVTLQGGYTEPAEEGPEAEFSKFVAATNGITLSKASQPVPGGLAGLVNCKEISNFILRASCELVFENGVTGVNSTLELARPASEIRISEGHLAEGVGVALKMPVKFRLENPFLGESCYVGSSSAPVIWNLTSGASNPPKGTAPITGKIGEVEFFEKGRILRLTNNELVDNGWAAPSTSGCGGIFSFILDPIVSLSAGLPSAAGKNVARLKNTINETTAFAVNKNNEENP